MATTTSITVYRGFQATGCYTWSPFVTKLEARLRFAGISYAVKAGSPLKAPRGKIPYAFITKPDQSTQNLGDSQLIIGQLFDDGVIGDLNANMSPVQRAHDLAVRALLEDKLYFYQVYERWIENYYTMRPVVLAAMPYPVQLVVGSLAYRGNKQMLHSQGTLRFTPQEIATFRQEIWQHINALLVASKRNAGPDSGGFFWLSGVTGPSETDAVLYGFIASALVCSAAPDSKAVIRGFPVIMEYAERIHDRFFPDYETWDQVEH